MGYCTTIMGVELELRSGSVVIIARADEIDGDDGRVDIDGEFLAKAVSALVYLGVTAKYDRGEAYRRVQEYERLHPEDEVLRQTA